MGSMNNTRYAIAQLGCDLGPNPITYRTLTGARKVLSLYARQEAESCRLRFGSAVVARHSRLSVRVTVRKQYADYYSLLWIVSI
jgi:hypothetical protein